MILLLFVVLLLLIVLFGLSLFYVVIVDAIDVFRSVGVVCAGIRRC